MPSVFPVWHTLLLMSGVPFCPKCDGEREAQKKREAEEAMARE
jgi:hypothetical protein